MQKHDWQKLKYTAQNDTRFAAMNHILSQVPDDHWPTCEQLSEVAHTMHPEVNITCVAQAPRSRRKRKDSSLASYIDQIALSRTIPTRENHTHDLFNFVTFMMFPHTKLAIMDTHKCESLLAPDGSTGGRARTRAQDLLTLFDEGGAIAVGDDTIIFGHGIYEMIIKNDQPVRAITWVGLEVSQPSEKSWPDILAVIDAQLARVVSSPLQLADSSLFPGRWLKRTATDESLLLSN